MLKNINNLIFAILILLFTVQCSKKSLKNSVDFNLVKLDTIQNVSTVKDVYFKKDTLNNNFNNLIIKNCILDYNFGEFDIDENIDNVIFMNDTINNLTFKKNTINKLEFNNCEIKYLLIKSASIKGLRIINCNISEIEIISSELNNAYIKTNSNSINNVLIKNCYNSKTIAFKGYYKSIILEGGNITYLNTTEILSNNTKLIINGTNLKLPDFYNSNSKSKSIIKNADISYSSFPKDFMLKEEEELNSINTNDSYNTKRIKIYNRFRYLVSSYNTLSEKYSSTNNKELSRYFYYKKNQIHNKLTLSRYKNYISIIWNEYFKGNYGTSVTPILITFLIVWILFSIIYYFLGYLNIIFFKIEYHITTKGVSEYITINKNNNYLSYFKHCLWFSLSQMMIGPIVHNINIGKFSVNYLNPPRTYKFIGIGSLLSLLQSIIGLILLFNFISVFINISLK